MESKKLKHPPTWQGKDGLDYQEQTRHEWDREEFPFRSGDRVVVKGPDTIWDTEGREHLLTNDMKGMVTEICHDPEWTTHLWVSFPGLGRVCVGWEMLTRDETSDEVKDHEQQNRVRCYHPLQTIQVSKNPVHQSSL
ncbi:hypothetical protein BB934_07620 [Microvirga ossetica]|uniref:Uncharacterized protein n=1 Tax=Microvirga ossetica TaxID=1882682 RepID=A0A1B2EDP7_9HYPH|nr:hypothetical protein [Microvirga ossetica]ANY78116.1 hypothetical protein BB934_07620 [Microvirga ossetica]